MNSEGPYKHSTYGHATGDLTRCLACAYAEGRKVAEKEIEEKKVVKDALLCGTGFMKDGKRVPPEDVYLSEAEIKLKKVEKDFKELLHLANEASYLNQDSMAWGIKYADWKKARGIE